MTEKARKAKDTEEMGSSVLEPGEYREESLQDAIEEYVESGFRSVTVSTGKRDTEEYREETIMVPTLNRGNYEPHLQEYGGFDCNVEDVLFKLATQALGTNMSNIKRREMTTPESASVMTKIRKADPETQAKIAKYLEDLGI